MKKFLASLLVLSVIVPVAMAPSKASAYFPASLKYGSKGDNVVTLEDFLQDRGYYLGKIDGRFGLGVRKAIIAFQLDNGLKGDGFFGMASRAKADELLAAELAPSLEAENEENIANPPAPESTPDPVVVTPPVVATTPPPAPIVTPTVQLPQSFVLSGESMPNFTYPEYKGDKISSVTIGSYKIKNTSTLKIRLTKMQISLFDQNGSKLDYTTTPSIQKFSSIRTTETSGVGMVPVLPMAVNNFDIDLTLYPGQEQRIDVIADLDSGAPITMTLTASGMSQ